MNDQYKSKNEWIGSKDFEKESVAKPASIDRETFDSLNLSPGDKATMSKYGIRSNSVFDEITKTLPISLSKKYMNSSEELPTISDETSNYLVENKMIEYDGKITGEGEKLLAEINPELVGIIPDMQLVNKNGTE